MGHRPSIRQEGGQGDFGTAGIQQAEQNKPLTRGNIE